MRTWEGAPHGMRRGHPKSRRWWAFVVHHLGVGAPVKHLGRHGEHVGRVGWSWTMRRWETLHVWRWKDRRTLEGDNARTCPQQAPRRGTRSPWWSTPLVTCKGTRKGHIKQ